MALNDFKPHFDNAYQEIFQKVLVSKKIANMRFKSVLTYGESIERVAYDITNVLVRDTVRGSASTIDTITDDSELLTINTEKEANFHLSDGEMKQAGPLNPGTIIGGKVAHKVATDFDARVFAQIPNAAYTFDTGDLTTLASTGTPITLSTTTVPQMVTRMSAKLRANNQLLTNLAFVVDSYGAAEMNEYLLSKNIDLAGSVYANGYSGQVDNAEVYVSENLTGSGVLSMATQATAADTVIINGVTFTFVAAIGTTAGNVLLGDNVDEARANLATLINTPGTTTATGVAVSEDDQITLADMTVVDSASADTLTLTAIGSGTLTLSETLTDEDDAWTKNYINCYFGKKGGIDAVMQDMKDVDVRPTSDRRGNNIFSSYLAGIKTFADGAKKFLNVKIAR